jgi:hypothetical protein
MLHQAGIDIWKITWVIAPIEGPADAGHGHVEWSKYSNVSFHRCLSSYFQRQA